MALLDTASLIVTPNGYKASKLYSIVPSDGTGDMTFSRTGNTATRVNSSGVIETVNANIPRLDYLGSTCPKLLMEPQRTNVILQSEDISSASWTKGSSPTIVTNVSVAPDGTTTADSIQSTSSSTYGNILQTFSASANSTYTFSVFVKKETTKTNFGGMLISFSGTSSKIVLIAFDEVNGTLSNLSSSTLTPTLKVDDYDTYWRFIATATDNGSNTNVQAYIYATISTNGTTLSTGVGSARTIWGAQLEAGTFATSYIPTTTASVTRNVDSCTKSSATALIGQTEGTLFWDVNINSRLSNTSFVIRNVGNTNLVRIIIAVSVIQATIYNSSTVTAAIDYTNSNTGRFKFAIGYKNNDIVYYVNGSLIGTDTDCAIPATSEIDLFANNTNQVKSNAYALWKTRLTNSELAQLTTL